MEEKKLEIALNPDVIGGVYSNLAIIAHSPSEFILDFACTMPGQDKAVVKSRVILTPDNAKKLLFALQTNIANYEKQFGKIELKGQAPSGTLPMSFGGQA